MPVVTGLTEQGWIGSEILFGALSEKMFGIRILGNNNGLF